MFFHLYYLVNLEGKGPRDSVLKTLSGRIIKTHKPIVWYVKNKFIRKPNKNWLRNKFEFSDKVIKL